MKCLGGQVFTPRGFLPGRLCFTRRVAGFVPGPAPERYILPGFIDLHVHGGGGADAMQGEAAIRRLARFHAAHGTTAMLPTTVCAPEAELRSALSGIEAVRTRPGPGEARVLGAHLEGPYLNPKKLGAQPPHARHPDPGEMASLLALARIRVVTLAPELPGALALIRHLAGAGIRVQIGHTDATYEEAVAALEAGAAGFTHLYNAMSGLSHRAPGAAMAALLRSGFAEIVADGLHVAPEAIRLARRQIPGLYVVTDAVAAAGMPDGWYALGRQRGQKRGDAVRRADGTLAGSTLTMDRALCNLVAWGVALKDAVAMLSRVPALYLGLTDRGSLAPGQRADVVVMDASLTVEEVYVEGRRVFPHEDA